MRAQDLWVAEDRAFKSDRFAAGLPSHIPPTITRHRRKNGSVAVMEATGRECRIEGNRAFLISLVDVSEREAAAAALLDANAKFAMAQRMALVGSWEADLDSGDLVGSDELHRILGLPSGVLRHATQLRGYIHPEDNPAHWGADVIVDHPRELLAVLERAMCGC